MSKTVVIGASSGLGRCIGVGLAERGDRVALLARRRERIETAAKEAGQGAVAVECDVTDEASVRSAISAAADGLGGIDNLVYTPAIGSVMRLVYLSSDAGTYGPPWPGLAAYGVSKAALERLIEAWRAEHPAIGFTNLIVGECAGGDGDSATGFSTAWDRELAGEFYPQWTSRGCMPGQLMPVEDLVDVVHTILRTNSATSMPVVVARGAP